MLTMFRSAVYFATLMTAAALQLKCGQVPVINDGTSPTRIDTRIIGGENAIKGEFPWQVALYHQGIQICGGSIIAPKWILTAAHCVKNNYGIYYIRAGEYNLKGLEGMEQEVEVLRIIRHVKYVTATYDNDIAIMGKSYGPFHKRIDSTHTEMLHRTHKEGWGKVSPDIPRSNILQKIQLPIYDFQECKRLFDKLYPRRIVGPHHPRVNSNMICAGFPEGGIDACKGDSGGPMACKSGKSMVLYGITSWGMGCGRKEPGYYTRVGNYVRWIGSVLDGRPSEQTDKPCDGAGVLIKGDFNVLIESVGFTKGSYKSNAHCTWTVEIPGSHATHYALLRFISFDVEDDQTCNYDYVKVFSGRENDRLLGTFCGQATPTPLTSVESLKFKIVFHSDGETNMEGFQISIKRFPKDRFVESNCGSLRHIRPRRKKIFEQNGVIESVKYPENYSPDTECEWNIRTIPGKSIQITFEDFQLEPPNGNGECTADSVTIFNGDSSDKGQRIGKPLCGSYDKSFQITSTGRRITLKFKSDSESEFRGFKASYRIFDNPWAPHTDNKVPLSLEQIARSQNIQSGSSNGECGFFPLPQILDTTGTSFQLVEGIEVPANSAPWTAHVHYCFRNGNVTKCKICDGSLVDAKWIITVAHCFEENSELISLNVSLGDHDKDVDEEYEVTTVGKTVYKYRGYNRSTLPVNDIALVELQHRVPYSGQIRPICLPSPDVCFAGGTVCVSLGWGGPATYGADTRKLRKAEVPLYDDESCREATGEKYHNSFVCGGLKKGPNHKDQCGQEGGGGLICRAGLNQPWILYGIVSYGYGCIGPGSPSLYTKISVLSDWITTTMEKNVTKPPSSKTMSCSAQNKKDQYNETLDNPCYVEQILQDASGVITSHNYPEPYGKNLHCVWTINAPDPDRHVMIDIEGEEGRCWDKLTIFRSDGSMIKNSICNEREPAVPYLFKGGASVHFETDRSGEFTGFKLTYQTVTNTTLQSNCGSDYHLKGSGSIQSLQYPNHYPPLLHCEWLLQSTSNNGIELTITAIQLESDEGCPFDFLEVYESDDGGNKVRKLARLCGLHSETHEIISRKPYTLVRFKVDGSGGASGFQSEFRSLQL